MTFAVPLSLCGLALWAVLCWQLCCSAVGHDNGLTACHLAILLGVGLAGSSTSVTLDSACAPSALTSLALPTIAGTAIEQATHAAVSHTLSLPHTATCTVPSRSTASFRYIAALSMLHATSFRTPALFLFRFPAMPSVHSQRTPPCCFGGLRFTAHASLKQALRVHLRPPSNFLSKGSYRLSELTKHELTVYTLLLDSTSHAHEAASASVMFPFEPDI